MNQLAPTLCHALPQRDAWSLNAGVETRNRTTDDRRGQLRSNGFLETRVRFRHPFRSASAYLQKTAEASHRLSLFQIHFPCTHACTRVEKFGGQTSASGSTLESPEVLVNEWFDRVSPKEGKMGPSTRIYLRTRRSTN
jgi:hypothetical protein